MRREYKRNKNRLKFNRRKNLISSILKNIFLYGSVAIVVLVVGLLGYFYIEYKPVLQDSYDSAMSKIDGIEKKDFRERSNSIIYYEDGEVMKQLNKNDYHYIEYKDIPQVVEDALLSIEDIRYYEHSGVDMKAIMRAGYSLIKNKGNITQGGSTITQQLVKLKFLTLEKSYERKLQEVIIAHNLEKKFSKTEILEFYLNIINYGSGAYGIESASYIYFNKDIADLSLSEVAFLTGIPNNPTVYNPVINYDNTIKRRNLILSKMLEYEKISEKEYNEAIKEEIVLDMNEKKYEPDNYDVSFIISSSAKEIMRQNDFNFKYWFDSDEERKEYLSEYNIEFKEAEHIVRNSGFKIYSTIDKGKQEKLQASVDNNLSGFTGKNSESGLYNTQSSAVSIDNITNEVVAIVGGRSQSDINNTYNRAFLSKRQPGSAIKPLVAYLPALEEGLLGSTMLNDSKEEKGPGNVDLKYRGQMSMREAIARSVNTVPYKLMSQYGARNFLGYLEDMEFSGLDYRDNNASTSIGGFTYGTNTYEMANAFHTVANNGEFIRMTGVRKIEDRYGDIFYEDVKEGKIVYDSGTSFLMTDMLKGVINESYGTSKDNKLNRDDIGTAAKTGTTNGYRDLWYAGYTPYYTTVVWLGNDTPASIRNGSKFTKAIWKTYMDDIHKDLKGKDFEVPNRVKKAYVNPKTGAVSNEKKSGWVNQWVTAVYIEKLAAKKAEEEAKKRAEEMARYKKEQEEIKRLAKEREEELKRLGMTEKDVEEELILGKEILDKLIYLDIEKKEEYDSKVVPILKEVYNELNKIRFPENIDKLREVYDAERNRLINKKENLIKMETDEEILKLQKQKELEAAEKAADEAIKEEEEKRIQEEVNKRLEEERRKDEAKREEEERKKAEEERKKAEEERKKEEEEREKEDKEDKENNLDGDSEKESE